MNPRLRSWALSESLVDVTRPRSAGRSATVEARPQRLVFDPDRTALVVVDMQNDFCARGGWLDSIGVDVSPAAAAIGPISALLPVARSAGVPVIWLNWGNRPDRADLPPNVLHVYDADGTGAGIGEKAADSPAVLTKGSWGAAVVDGLEVDDADLLVDKHRMSGFFGTPLDAILRRLGADTVLFAGVNADQCVLATLTDAACLGYDVVMIEGASATTSPAFCYDAAVYNVRQCFGFTTETPALIAALETSRR